MGEIKPDKSRPASLTVHNLSCIRGERELFAQLSFELRPRDIVHIAGANGSGKTSLLRILCALNMPETGDILWDGVSIFQDRATFLHDMQYVGHLSGIKPELSPLENMLCMRALHRQTGTAIDSVVERLGLAGFEYEPAYRLSSGQRRRIALARLLLNPSRLWILDEPFTALDAAGCKLLTTMVDEQLQRDGMVVFASHSHTDLFPAHIRPHTVRLVA
jgi:heme exporter protein A